MTPTRVLAVLGVVAVLNGVYVYSHMHSQRANGPWSRDDCAKLREAIAKMKTADASGDVEVNHQQIRGDIAKAGETYTKNCS